MMTRLILLIVLVAPLPAGATMEVVFSIPVEELRGELRDMSPSYDYGEIRVDVWADTERDCFQSYENVRGAFYDWIHLANPFGIPGVVEIRCMARSQKEAITVITTSSARNRPPQRLWIFESSPSGDNLGLMLVNDGVGGTFVVDSGMDFSSERGWVTSVVLMDRYPERADHDETYPEWMSTRIYLLGDELRQMDLDVLAVYRIHGSEKSSFTFLVRGSENNSPTWSLKTIGSKVEEISTAKFGPRNMGASKADRIRRDMEVLDPVLRELDMLTSADDVTAVFESPIVGSYLEAFRKAR